MKLVHLFKTAFALFKLYLELWKQEGVDGNNYPRYAILFDRDISWSQKTDLIKTPYDQ